MVCPLGQKSSFKTCPAYNLKSFWDRVNLKIYGGGDHDFYIHGFEVLTFTHICGVWAPEMWDQPVVTSTEFPKIR